MTTNQDTRAFRQSVGDNLRSPRAPQTTVAIVAFRCAGRSFVAFRAAKGRSFAERKTTFPTAPRRRPHRAGVVLPVIVMALFAVMLLGAAICQTFVAQQRANRMAEQRLQSLWILESATQRGVQRLANEDDYEGETWEIPAESLGSQHAGRAVIRIEEVTEPQAGHRLHIDVQFPADDVHRTVFHRELFTASTGSGGSS